jgi:hypothetical protein
LQEAAGSAVTGNALRLARRGLPERISCPNSGKILSCEDQLVELGVNNAEPDDLEELVEYLARTTRLERGQAERLVDEVLSFLGEQPEQFVRRRHLELQRQGLSNALIFSRLERELSRRRFAAPAYSRRQLRRIVYG